MTKILVGEIETGIDTLATMIIGTRKNIVHSVTLILDTKG
jgi:hypothetical protein